MSKFALLQKLPVTLIAPHPKLKPWVQCYWFFEYCGAAVAEQNFYPDGGSSLIFPVGEALGGPVKFDASQAPKKVSLHTPALGVRFTACGAHRLLRLPMHELAGVVSIVQDLPRLSVPSDLMLGLEGQSTGEVVALLNRWLLKNLAMSPGVPLIEGLVHLANADATDVKAWLDHNGVHIRKAERLVKQTTGANVRQLTQWAKVKAAREIIKANAHKRLTDVALECGYYDQAHFNRQFKKVTGLTPASYQKKTHWPLSIIEIL